MKSIEICKSASAVVTLLVTCLSLGMVAVTPASAGADTEQYSIERLTDMMKSRVHYGWQLRKFEQLDAEAQGYRTTKMRDESGTIWLASFYQGFEMFLARGTPEQMLGIWNPTRLEWIKKYPESPTPHIAHATILYKLAWMARGSGYANTVFEKDMDVFVERLTETRDYLIAHKSVASADPEYARLLAVTEFLLTGDNQALLNSLYAALEKFPNYVEYYYTAAQYTRPAWGGTQAQFDDLLRRASIGGEKAEGTGLVARVYRAGYGSPDRYLHIKNQGPLWPTMKKSIADEMRFYPDWRTAERFLAMACLAKDPEVVTDLLRVIVKASKGRAVLDEPRQFCGWDRTADAGQNSQPDAKPKQEF